MIRGMHDLRLHHFAALVALVAPLSTVAESQESGYRLPPQAIVDVLDAAPTPGVSFSPDARRMLLVERPAMPSIAAVAAPWEGLAGMRIDPALRAQRILSYAHTLRVQDTASGALVDVALPEGARVAQTAWSPDGESILMTLAGDAGLELWSARAADGTCRRLATGLNSVLVSPFQFAEGGRALWLALVPEDLAPPPARAVPTGPAIQETAGSSTPLRTYQDLLSDAESEARFEYLCTSQLARLDLATGALTKVGAPAMYSDVNPSPDGSHLIVQRMQRPFSYVLPASLFPSAIEVWTAAGERLRTVAEVPLGEHIPMEGVRTGPRSVQWRANAPHTLVWVEAQDGGDPSAPAELRDIWYAQDAPFQRGARELVRLAHRARGLSWLSQGERLLATEFDRDRRWTRTWLVDLSADAPAPVLVEDRSQNDRYGDPGSVVMVDSSYRTTRVVWTDGTHVLRSGPGHSPSGPRPFLARSVLATGAAERLWQSATDRYESVAEVVVEDGAPVAVVTTSESPTEPANHQWRSLVDGSVRALTRFADPTPQIRGIKQELLTYERADGVKLSGTLYLPADHVEGTKLPLFVWAYPLEYTDPATAGQNTNATTRALRIRGASHLALVLAGYAVLDNATMPVVGDPETMNDTFVEQIVASAQAAIDACVARGVADPDHVGVGGHSYGAFMTANLLAHCDLFRAGIARSGAYNRTLTPFGFQSERRTIWQARDTYVTLSPFFVADRIDEPLLMIHGEKDSNTGTFPIQSERLYQAVKGNGGAARLVMLPGEDHGYQARESVLHTVAEMLDWCERHVRSERPAQVEASAPK
jgi:dipeptidyl aminopeptidase/acylaminoacyl peptidase